MCRAAFHCRRRIRGFTLIELLVVLAILGLLALIAVPQVLKYLSAAKIDTAQLQIQQLGLTLDLYRLDVGRYPTEEQGLESMLTRPPDAERWNGPYLRKQEMLLDPWAAVSTTRAFESVGMGSSYGYRLLATW